MEVFSRLISSNIVCSFSWISLPLNLRSCYTTFMQISLHRTLLLLCKHNNNRNKKPHLTFCPSFFVPVTVVFHMIWGLHDKFKIHFYFKKIFKTILQTITCLGTISPCFSIINQTTSIINHKINSNESIKHDIAWAIHMKLTAIWLKHSDIDLSVNSLYNCSYNQVIFHKNCYHLL